MLFRSGQRKGTSQVLRICKAYGVSDVENKGQEDDGNKAIRRIRLHLE
jgi:hypothetical protein